MIKIFKNNFTEIKMKLYRVIKIYEHRIGGEFFSTKEKAEDEIKRNQIRDKENEKIKKLAEEDGLDYVDLPKTRYEIDEVEID